jgi:hypothetical protein
MVGVETLDALKPGMVLERRGDHGAYDRPATEEEILHLSCNIFARSADSMTVI